MGCAHPTATWHGLEPTLDRAISYFDRLNAGTENRKEITLSIYYGAKTDFQPGIVRIVKVRGEKTFKNWFVICIHPRHDHYGEGWIKTNRKSKVNPYKILEQYVEGEKVWRIEVGYNDTAGDGHCRSRSYLM